MAAPLSVPVQLIERRIYLIRGEKIMLDADLAELYEVLTKNLNKAVKRNLDRFPADFMFRLTKQEADSLRFQIGTSKEAAVGGATCPMPLPSKGWRCCPLSSTAIAP